MRRSDPATGSFVGGDFAWRLVWIALLVLIVVLPALDLGWGEMRHHGQPCPFHASLVTASSSAMLVGPCPSNAPLPADPVRSWLSVAASIFIPPRP